MTSLTRTASGDYEGDHTIRSLDHGAGLVQLRMSCGHKLMGYSDTPDGTEFSCPLCGKRVRVERKRLGR